MSPRSVPPASSGSDDPTPPRGTRRTDHGGDPARPAERSEWDDDRWDDGDWDEPNYLVRRALVVGSVVAAVAVVGIVASRFIGGDDSASDAAAQAASWDTAVVLTNDTVTLIDPESGDEVDTFDATIDLLDAQSLVARDVLVTLTDEGAIGLLDLNAGTSRRGRAGIDHVLTVSVDNPFIALVGPETGGDVTIIDTTTRDIFSVADVAGLSSPLVFTDDIRVNPSGSHVAIPVPSAFQSFVIDVANQTSEAFAGRVIAISDDLVVTEQPAGDEAEIEFHQLGGDRLATVDVPTPRASLLTDDGSLLLVAADGTVRIVDSDGTVEENDQIIDEAGSTIQIVSGFAAHGGNRLVAQGAADTVAVLDADGTVLGSAAGQVDTALPRSTRCLTIGTGQSTDPSTVIDLEDASVITTIERGLPAATSVDGCTVALLGGTDNLLVDGELTSIDARSISEVAPDGGGVVGVNGGATEYVRVGEDDAIEIADEPAVVRFAERG